MSSTVADVGVDRVFEALVWFHSGSGEVKCRNLTKKPLPYTPIYYDPYEEPLFIKTNGFSISFPYHQCVLKGSLEFEG